MGFRCLGHRTLESISLESGVDEALFFETAPLHRRGSPAARRELEMRGALCSAALVVGSEYCRREAGLRGGSDAQRMAAHSQASNAAADRQVSNGQSWINFGPVTAVSSFHRLPRASLDFR